MPDENEDLEKEFNFGHAIQNPYPYTRQIVKDDVFYVATLIEFLRRKTQNTHKTVVQMIGLDGLRHLLDYANLTPPTTKVVGFRCTFAVPYRTCGMTV